MLHAAARQKPGVWKRAGARAVGTVLNQVSGKPRPTDRHPLKRAFGNQNAISGRGYSGSENPYSSSKTRFDCAAERKSSTWGDWFQSRLELPTKA